VPLHSAILAEGFLTYVAEVRRLHGDGPLFPGVGLDKHGKRSTKASADIMEFIRGLGITDSRKVFYSWRHDFKTRSKGSGYTP